MADCDAVERVTGPESTLSWAYFQPAPDSHCLPTSVSELILSLIYKNPSVINLDPLASTNPEAKIASRQQAS